SFSPLVFALTVAVFPFTFLVALDNFFKPLPDFLLLLKLLYFSPVSFSYFLIADLRFLAALDAALSAFWYSLSPLAIFLAAFRFCFSDNPIALESKDLLASL